jgi:uncharacterized protein YggU (UPF0235/DUF167 family)
MAGLRRSSCLRRRPGVAEAPRYPFQQTQSGVTLFIRLKPRAASDQLGVVADSGDKVHLEASVRAVPDKGAANSALLRLLAKRLDLPRSTIQIARGASARHKAIRIQGDPELLAQRLRSLMPESPGIKHHNAGQEGAT